MSEPRKPSLEEILATLRAHLPELRARYGVRSLGVFGSYVRGEATPDRDLDILVEFDTTPGFFKFIELEHELGRVLGLKVDLVMKSALRPWIGEHILAELVPV